MCEFLGMSPVLADSNLNVVSVPWPVEYINASDMKTYVWQFKSCI